MSFDCKDFKLIEMKFDIEFKHFAFNMLILVDLETSPSKHMTISYTIAP